MKIPMPFIGFKLNDDHSIDKKEWVLSLTIGYIHSDYIKQHRMMWYDYRGKNL